MDFEKQEKVYFHEGKSIFKSAIIRKIAFPFAAQTFSPNPPTFSSRFPTCVRELWCARDPHNTPTNTPLPPGKREIDSTTLTTFTLIFAIIPTLTQTSCLLLPFSVPKGFSIFPK
uniref:Uncharacterized protein n=1 Tax=Cacopsylla melanoneura TaxID=428564 RepID=A0A8D8WA39_9HEMI